MKVRLESFRFLIHVYQARTSKYEDKFTNRYIGSKMITLGYEFCYWECRSSGDLAIIMFDTLAGLLLTCYIASIWWKKARGAPDYKNFKTVYMLLLAQGTISFCSYIYSILAYFLAFGDDDHRINRGGSITTHSRIYAAIFSLNALFILFILSYIPYHMMTNMAEILSHNQLHLNRSEYRFYNKFLKNFLRCKWVPHFIPIILLCIPFPDNYSYEVINYWKLVYQAIDSIFCVVVLFYCRSFMLRKLRLLQIDSQQNLKRLKLEIDLLTLSGLCWLISFLIFHFLVPNIKNFSNSPIAQPDKYYTNYKCIQPLSEHLDYSLLYLFLGYWVLEFLPILVPAIMFHPQIEKTESSFTYHYSMS